ncbi:MAG TPA: T9SS type A sorting domain-containing protein, partial [Chitinophagales bacterium]|nr:T9SS type A sorting domain-containing protein [Chitinophagales bacterium]
LSIATALVFQTIFAQYCGTSGPSMCSPTGTQSQPGLFPPSEALPPLINGEAPGTVLQFKNFDTIMFGGQVLTIQTLRIDSIGNLPAGICWASDRANNTWSNQQSGCISLNGTTCAAPGQYKLKLIITVNVGVPIQTDADAANLKYYLRVKNATDIDIPVDTTQTSNAPFIAYGGAADCNPVFSVSLGSNQTVCNNSNVTLNPVVHSGVPPYTYNWSSSGPALNCTTCQHPQVTVNQNSTYSVTVIDATNASVSAQVSYTTTGGNNLVQFTANNTDISCASSTGQTTITISGGTQPYTVNWGDGTTPSSGTTSQNHSYPQAGTYVISVADANNCVTANANTINFNGILITATQTTQPNCVNQNTGSIIINATGGTAPYAYTWSNTATTSAVTGLMAGIYVVTVTDATACTFSKTFNLAPLNGWGYYVYTAPSVSNCNNNGAITTSIYGGIPPYTFNWSNGSTVQNPAGLAGGVYHVSVSDVNGCVATAAATVPTSCYSIVSGNVFSDANNNCLFDIGEDEVSSIYITAQGTNGQTYYGYAGNNGTYTIQIPESGTFTLGATSYTYYGSCGTLSLCGNSNHTVTLATLGDTSANNNFGFQGATGYNFFVFPRWSSGNPGFDKTYTIHAGNFSPINFAGQATVTFVYDSNLIYQSSTPAASHNLATHTLTWLVDSLNTYSFWGGPAMYITFLVPQTLSLGYLLQSDFSISPTSNDCDTTNNHMHTSDAVTGSFDPNEKKVLPAGDIFEEDSVLTYEIGFQNTGTDSTHFIIIKDTLSPHLDPATVRNIASSHPYSDFTISGAGILTWTFNPLRLVDSFTNEPESHGFVRFTIKKKPNLPLNTQISNTAHIYFDYNVPVVTNTVTNKLTEPNGIWHIRSTSTGITVKAMPNPFSQGTNIVVDGITGRYDFELYDVTGKQQNRIPAIETRQFYVDRNNLPAGIYFFKVLSADKKKSGYGKLVVE